MHCLCQQLVSSARQRTCTSVVSGQNVAGQVQCGGFGASAIFPGLITARLFPVPLRKSGLKGQRFSSPDVTAKAARPLTELSKSGFQECFQESFTNVGKIASLPKGTVLKEMVCK
jgi:hypothetical protein